MSKLTLSVDDAVIARAKRYAEQTGTSVSRLVEAFLDLIARTPEPEEEPPTLRRLRGSLKGARVGEHRRHLERKYR